MKQLSRLVLGSCYLLCLSGVTLAKEANSDIPSVENVTPSQNSKLSAEENLYILQECESFADEDTISAKERPEYLETCVRELSVAVKNAIEKLKAKSESTIGNNSEDNTTN